MDDFWPEPYWEHGPFRVYKDDGVLKQKTDDGWERICFIFDRDSWPWDRASELHCEALFEDWNNSVQGGHEAEAQPSAYELFGAVHLN